MKILDILFLLIIFVDRIIYELIWLNCTLLPEIDEANFDITD